MFSLLSIVGAVSMFYLALKLLVFIVRGTKTLMIQLLRDEVNFKRRYGKWAVVTGCTSGIGKAYATLLAKKGLNVVLISRSREKLQVMAEEIESQFMVETKIHVADFTGSVDIYREIEETMRELDIGILVNNVGMAQIPQKFVDSDKNDCWKLLNVNCLSVLLMTKIVLPGMIARGKGLVINISSAAGEFPSPMMQTYSGTKAFVKVFSACLNLECSGTGIEVQCIIPLVVATNMTINALNLGKPSLMCPGPDDYVTHALRTVGLYSVTHGYWPHSLQAFIIGCFPAMFVEKHIFLLLSLISGLKRTAL